MPVFRYAVYSYILLASASRTSSAFECAYISCGRVVETCMHVPKCHACRIGAAENWQKKTPWHGWAADACRWDYFRFPRRTHARTRRSPSPGKIQASRRRRSTSTTRRPLDRRARTSCTRATRRSISSCLRAAGSPCVRRPSAVAVDSEEEWKMTMMEWEDANKASTLALLRWLGPLPPPGRSPNAGDPPDFCRLARAILRVHHGSSWALTHAAAAAKNGLPPFLSFLGPLQTGPL